MTCEGDLVLVHVERKPAFFARIEAIGPDPKPGWFQVKLLVLQVPLVMVTWILRDVYIDGEEFTMGGHPMRLEKVVAPVEEKLRGGQQGVEPSTESESTPAAAPDSAPRGKVVSLFDRRKDG